MMRMTAPDFANIEAKIRAEADTKMAAARDLAAARRTLLDYRTESATIDAANLKAVADAEAAARAAGFDNKTLADWNLTDTKSGARTRHTTRGRSTTGRSTTKRTRAHIATNTVSSAATNQQSPTEDGTDDATKDAPTQRSGDH